MGVDGLINAGHVAQGWAPIPVEDYITPTYGDLFDAAAVMVRRNFNVNAEYATTEEALRPSDEKLEALGYEIPWGGDITSRRQKTDEYIIGKRAEGDTRFNQESGILTREEAQRLAPKMAIEASTRFERVHEATEPGPMRWWTSLAGNLVGGLDDPLNIASMLFTAGAGTTLLRSIAIGAGTNVAVEALSQPAVGDWQRRLGRDYGLKDIAPNLAMAAALGAGGEALSHGASGLFRRLAAKPEVRGAERAAAEAMERYSYLRDREPSGAYDPESVGVHFDNVREAAARFEQGESVVVPDYVREEIALSVKREVDDLLKSEWHRLGYSIANDGSIVRTASKQEMRGLMTLEDFDKMEANYLANYHEGFFTTLDQLRNPKKIPAPPKEESLLSFIVKKGGLHDREGWVKASDGLKERPGLISNKGIGLDKMLRYAQEAGFLEMDGPTYETAKEANDLLDLITQELGGKKVYRPEAEVRLQEYTEFTKNLDDTDRMLSESLGDWQKLSNAEVVKKLEESGLMQPSAMDRTEYGPDLSTSPFESRPLSDMMESVENMDHDIADAALEADFERVITENGDMVVELGDRRLTLKELLDENKNNEAVLAEITSCASGVK